LLLLSASLLFTSDLIVCFLFRNDHFSYWRFEIKLRLLHIRTAKIASLFSMASISRNKQKNLAELVDEPKHRLSSSFLIYKSALLSSALYAPIASSYFLPSYFLFSSSSSLEPLSVFPFFCSIRSLKSRYILRKLVALQSTLSKAIAVSSPYCLLV
jgi:hypothetical protein